MKLWLISQEENNGYDTFDSAVVAAATEEAARRVVPSFGGLGNRYIWGDNGKLYLVWPDGTQRLESFATWAQNLSAVQVKYLGEAADGTEAGTVLASFNAG
jgi:hypothetical protein